MEENKLKIIIDQVGRTIIGELAGETDTTVTIKNPCNIFIQSNEQGQLQVQTIPLFFREFLTLDGRTQGVDFTFNKDQITDSNAAANLDTKLINQYNQVIVNFAQPDDTQPEAGSTEPGEVVQLFND